MTTQYKTYYVVTTISHYPNIDVKRQVDHVFFESKAKAFIFYKETVGIIEMYNSSEREKTLVKLVELEEEWLDNEIEPCSSIEDVLRLELIVNKEFEK